MSNVQMYLSVGSIIMNSEVKKIIIVTLITFMVILLMTEKGEGSENTKDGIRNDV